MFAFRISSPAQLWLNRAAYLLALVFLAALHDIALLLALEVAQGMDLLFRHNLQKLLEGIVDLIAWHHL